MSELRKEKKAEIKGCAAEYQREIRAEKKKLPAALAAYKKVAVSLTSSVEKYERAKKKYDIRSIEKNRLVCHFAKEKLIDAVLSHNEAAAKVNSSVELIDKKYLSIYEISLKLPGKEALAAANKRMSFIRKITSQINEAEEILAGVDFPEVDAESREIISWKKFGAASPASSKAWNAHDIQNAITEAKGELAYHVKNCKSNSKRLAKSAKSYFKAKEKHDARPGAKRELSYNMAREEYLKALSEYNTAAAAMNRCVDRVWDGYDDLKKALSGKRKRAALRVAAEQDRYARSFESKLSAIQKPIKDAGIPPIK